jgi:extradiol dioxygenase
MNPIALGYVGVTTARAAEWLDFAPSILAADAQRAADGSVRVRIDERPYRLAIHAGPDDELSYIGWEVADKAAVEAAFEQFDRAGYSPAWGDEELAGARGVGHVVSVRDPTAGTRHEVFCDPSSAAEPFVPPRPHGGFVTGDQGMGHVVCDTIDIAGARSFILEGIGLRPTDIALSENGAEAHFFHCNPRHHSYAVVTGPHITAYALRHVMFENENLDDVGVALDLCHDLGVPLFMSLGRHHNDRMVSFYIRSPSGFAVEYGWGGLRVDDSWVPISARRQEIWGHRYVDALSDPGAATT